MRYKARDYWETRLSVDFSLGTTGHIGFSKYYNRFMYQLKARALEKAVRRYKVKIKGNTVLDVGSGTGFFVDYYIRKHALAVTGIDIAEVSVSLLKKKFPAQRFYRFDVSLDTLAFEGKFDIIHVFDVLYHIVDQQGFRNAIENISRFAGPGAWIFITDAFNSQTMTEPHVCFRKLPEYQSAFRRQEVDIIGIIPIFNLMGRSPCKGDKSFLSRLCARSIDSMAWFIYWMDRMYCPQSSQGIQLLICRKK
ncbi:MAG: class I SAM-dependent methyltransferase [Candidatus Omnitrophota bacterium]|jgi:SAM-dependent methyltransferase